MDEYDCVRKSSLKFKGEKRKKKSKKDRKKFLDDEASVDELKINDSRLEDAKDHGGWWRVEKYEQIRDDVSIEFLPGCYAKSFSNGTIALGNPHPPGEPPDDEEIFTAICAGTNQVAFKSGFGRYLCVDSRKRLMGLSEAIGEQESFLPVFEDGKTAICACNGNFLSPDEETEQQPIVAKSDKAGSYEMLSIRIPRKPH